LINYSTQDLRESVKTLTGGKGADRTVEAGDFRHRCLLCRSMALCRLPAGQRVVLAGEVIVSAPVMLIV